MRHTMALPRRNEYQAFAALGHSEVSSVIEVECDLIPSLAKTGQNEAEGATGLLMRSERGIVFATLKVGPVSEGSGKEAPHILKNRILRS
jgi:hypothetical protein